MVDKVFQGPPVHQVPPDSLHSLVKLEPVHQERKAHGDQLVWLTQDLRKLYNQVHPVHVVPQVLQDPEVCKDFQDHQEIQEIWVNPVPQVHVVPQVYQEIQVMMVNAAQTVKPVHQVQLVHKV